MVATIAANAMPLSRLPKYLHLPRNLVVGSSGGLSVTDRHRPVLLDVMLKTRNHCVGDVVSDLFEEIADAHGVI